MIPLLVTMLSRDELTVYYLFNAYLAFAPFITSAVNSAYIRGISFAWGGASSYQLEKPVPEGTPPNETFFSQIYRSSNLLLPALGILISLLIGLSGYFGLKRQILELDDPSVGWICWVALIFCISFKILLDRNGSVLKGIGQIALLNRCTVFFGLSNIALTCFLLFKGYKLYAIPSGLFFMYTGLALLQRQLLKKSDVAHLLTHRVTPIHQPTLQSVWRSSSRESVISVLTMGVTRGAAIIAAFFLIGEELTTYLNAVSLMIIVSTSSRAPFYAHNPRFAKLRAKHEVRILAQETGKSIRNAFYAFVAFACFVAVVVPVIFTIIGSNVDFIDAEIWLVMAVVGLIARYEAMNIMIIKSSNKIPFIKEQLITSAIKVLLMVIGVKYYGVMGIVLAQGIASMVIMNWLAPRGAWRSLGEYAGLHRKQYVWHGLTAMIILCFAVWNSGIASEILLQQYRLIEFFWRH